MQTTANLGLRKPEDTDPVAIQDFNDNADIIDREMAKKAEKTGDGSEMTAKFNEASGLANLVSGEKLSTSFGKLMKAVAELAAHLANKSNPHVVTKSQVGLGSVDNTSDVNKPVSTKQQTALDAKVTASGGDIANTRITNFVASSESYPIPAANDTVNVGFGKIKKFFEDIRNTTTGACFIGQIVNNCVTNNAKLPLSAAQGKVLMDLYAKLNSDKLAVSAFNSHKSSGDHDGRYYTEGEVNSLISPYIRYYHGAFLDAAAGIKSINFTFTTNAGPASIMFILASGVIFVSLSTVEVSSTISDAGVYIKDLSGGGDIVGIFARLESKSGNSRTIRVKFMINPAISTEAYDIIPLTNDIRNISIHHATS